MYIFKKYCITDTVTYTGNHLDIKLNKAALFISWGFHPTLSPRILLITTLLYIGALFSVRRFAVVVLML